MTTEIIESSLVGKHHLDPGMVLRYFILRFHLLDDFMIFLSPFYLFEFLDDMSAAAGISTKYLFKELLSRLESRYYPTACKDR